MYMTIRHAKPAGFTIVELLIVIVVIAILAAITIVAYNGITNRANDTRRQHDMSVIKEALMAYAVDHGGTPVPSKYYDNDVSETHAGWDASTDDRWLSFLRESHGSMPVDPVNTLTTNDPPADGNTAYFYYCYAEPYNYDYPDGTAAIGYHKTDGTKVLETFNVGACL